MTASQAHSLVLYDLLDSEGPGFFRSWVPRSPALVPATYGGVTVDLISDAEIAALIKEEKPLPVDFRARLWTKTKPGHKETEIEVVGAASSRFWLILRQSLYQALDFSIIVAFQPPGTYSRFILRRYNGKSHEHGNGLEGDDTFYDFHIHIATERYQKAGWAHEEHFAEPTDRYGSVEEALDCALKDCNFREKGARIKTLEEAYGSQ